MFKLVVGTLVASAGAVLNIGKALSFQGNLGSFVNCGSSTDHAKNLVVTIDPATPVVGQNFTTIFDYDLDKVVTGGIARYYATLNGLPVLNQDDDLCVDQGSADPCPLATGHHTDYSTSEMPSFTGKLISKLTWLDQDNEQVLCVQMTYKELSAASSIFKFH